MSAETTAIITSRVPMALRRAAELAAQVEGSNLSRFTCEAVREKAAKTLLDQPQGAA